MVDPVQERWVDCDGMWVHTAEWTPSRRATTAGRRAIAPVLLVHGDDDRNVAFQQTTGLVQLLRARDVEYELIVFPDDTHESMLHSRWIYTLDRMEQFIDKHLNGGSRRVITSAR